MLAVWVGGSQLDTVNTVWALAMPEVRAAAAAAREMANVFIEMLQ